MSQHHNTDKEMRNDKIMDEKEIGDSNSPVSLKQFSQHMPNDTDLSLPREFKTDTTNNNATNTSHNTQIKTILSINHNYNTKRDKIKIQIKKLGNQILYKHETIFSKILLKLNKPNWIKHFDLQISIIMMFVTAIIATIFEVLDSIIEISPMIRAILHLLIFICLASLLLNCNHRIFKDGLQSFVV